MPSLIPRENQYLAQHVCDELDKVVGDNRDEIILNSGKDLLEELIKSDRGLAKAVREELLDCYPKIFEKDSDLPEIPQ